MANIVLATPTLSDAGTITGPDSVGDMTIGNLQKMSLARKYRTNTLSGTIAIDLGSANSINCVALIGHNATSSGTVTVKAGTTSAVSDYTSGSLSLISGSDLGYDSNVFFLFLSSSQNYQYWAIEYSDASNADGYFEAGRIYLADAFQPSTNIDYGIQRGFVDNSKVRRTISGNAVTLIRNPYRVYELSLSFLSESEALGTLYEIDRLRGISRDVLLCVDPDATTHMQRQLLYGLMSELPAISNDYFQLYQKKYKFEEIPA